MTTVNVVLTPGVDTDQQPSAQAQIDAAPSGTLANPTIINMPAGRYRMDRKLSCNNKSHIRWTCLAGVPVYPNFPTDSQAFVAYTDLSSTQLGLTQRQHFQIYNSTNCIGSFLRIDGPNVFRRAADPNYALWGGSNYNDHGFEISASTDSGFEDCSWHNVYGDGTYFGGVNTRSVGCHAYRMTGDYAGRMNLALISCINTEVIDYTGDWSGFAGFDLEPLGADEWVWDAYCENIHMGSYFFPFTFVGHNTTLQGVTVPVGKKNIHLKDCSVIRCASVNHRSLQTQNDAAGYIIIDGLTDMRNRATIGITLEGGGTRWDDITVKNCRIRGYPNAATTYGMNAYVNDSLTITNNNFNGTQTDGGSDNLVAIAAPAPPIYVHYGNFWNMGASNDGVPPVALAATPGQITLTGGTASIDVVPAPLPQPAFIPTFVGGAPFRLRSQKGWGRLRGAAGARLRGTEGPAERHSMRLRSPGGFGRLRSAQYPSFLRSMEPTPNPQTFLSVNSGSIGIEGGTAALATTLQATSGHLSMAMGTATTSVVGTVYTLAATSGALSFSGGTATLSERLAATSGQLVLAGSASLNRGIPETSGHVSLAGGTALLGISLAATSGTLSLVGGSAGFNGQVTYTATAGTMTLAGGTATLRITTATTSGQVAIAGGTATLSLGKIIHATPGELAILGGQAGLHTLYAVDTATIVISGGTAELGGNTVRNLHATGGTITITGGTAHLTTGSPYPEWPMGELAPEWEMVG